jgi:hypothetical protein
MGVEARDWEDMAIGPGPVSGHDYLYAADIGDNRSRNDVKMIYRVPEPVVQADQDPVETWLSGVETISFRYPDGKRDAETLLVDPLTADIYVISKQEKDPHVYRATYPQSTTQVITLELVTKLPITQITSGDVSPTGEEILLKTYDSIYLFRRQGQEPLWRAFDRPGIKLPYAREPQGEAIAWRADGKGYYTLSEERDKIPAFLYFYPRLTD